MIKKLMFSFFILFYLVSLSYSGTITVGGQTIQVNDLSTVSSTSQAIASGKLAFGGIIIKTDGTNNVTLNIYDNTGASGKNLVPTDSIILGTSRIAAISYNPPIRCSNGIYVSVSVAGGGTCSYQVIYDIGN